MGLLLIKYTKKGEAINAQAYATTLSNLRAAIKEKRWGKLTTSSQGAHLKKELRGKRFSNDEEEENYFFTGIEKLVHRSHKCVDGMSVYIEK